MLRIISAIKQWSYIKPHVCKEKAAGPASAGFAFFANTLSEDHKIILLNASVNLMSPWGRKRGFVRGNRSLLTKPEIYCPLKGFSLIDIFLSLRTLLISS